MRTSIQSFTQQTQTAFSSIFKAMTTMSLEEQKIAALGICPRCLVIMKLLGNSAGHDWWQCLECGKVWVP